jgi:hypothetical protein
MKRSHLLLKRNDGIQDRSAEVKQEVVWLQKSLVGWHYLSGEGVDGEFGQNTESAVRSFQRDRGLRVDGEVGQDTWAALVKCAPEEVEIRERAQQDDDQGRAERANRICDAALALEGMDTTAGPDGGGNACLWAVNKVLRRAGIEPPWGDSLYVPDAHAALVNARCPEVEQQRGAIVIFTDAESPPYAHVGICVNQGQILSNSSSRGSFRWRDTPTGYRNYGYNAMYYLL